MSNASAISLMDLLGQKEREKIFSLCDAEFWLRVLGLYLCSFSGQKSMRNKGWKKKKKTMTWTDLLFKACNIGDET